LKKSPVFFTCLLALSVGSGVSARARSPLEVTKAVEKAVRAVNPALVRIRAVVVYHADGREMKSEATGSGVIFTREGHVITNHHVAGNAREISCTLATMDEMDAELVGTDPLTDICVLKLRPGKGPPDRGRASPPDSGGTGPPAGGFPVAKFGDSSRVRVGDPVLAMGSPLALSQSVTMGIVSNTQLVMPGLFWPWTFEVEGEDVGTLVRWIGHDASISPGNSGGPLVNLDGEVVGINEMQFGLGGAIPGNLAREVAESLIKQGKVDRSWIGLEAQPLLKSPGVRQGVLVSGTIPGSPAGRGGFLPGDILISLAGQSVSVLTPEELPAFNRLMLGLQVGREVEAVVARNGKNMTLRVAPEQWTARLPKVRELAHWGITARNLSVLLAKEKRRSSQQGVLVTSVRPGGPCDGAEPAIAENDIIVEVAGKPVASVEGLLTATQAITEGKSEPVPVLVAFERESERYLTVVKVGIKPLPEPEREARKAWLGVATQVLTREIAEALGSGEQSGVRVTQVYPGSSAQRVGLKVGDLILAVDGEPILASRPEHFEVFQEMLRQHRIASEVELTIVRDKNEQKVKVELEQSPPPAREARRYQDHNFEFTVRDLVFTDRALERWEEEQAGALVEAVSEGGWAALAHLAVGDVILEVDGQPTPDAPSAGERMKRIAEEKREAVVLHVRRGVHHLHIELQPKWSAAG
jgi:serine protease Do